MRLRNITGSREAIAASDYVVHEERACRGKWSGIFGNRHPIHIEIGMGKGQIRKMLLGESLLLVLAAVGVTMTVGTLCGYVLCGMLYRGGAFYMAFRFPTGLALAYGGVLTIVPVFITLVIMSRFAKDALVERLRSAENG